MVMRKRRMFWLALPALGFLAFFFVLPTATLAIDAFSDGIQAFVRVIALPGFWSSLAGSLSLTLLAATLSTLVGFLVALHLSSLAE